MRASVFVLGVLALVWVMGGCGNSNSAILKIVAERDSLRERLEAQSVHLRNYSETVEVMNETLDSMDLQERMIFMGTGETPATKEDVKNNLARFEATIKKQRERIEELEARLAAERDSASGALELIARLKEQLEMKDAQIARLNAELDKKNVSIAQLKSRVEAQQSQIDSQSATINELNQRTKRQGEALARQDEMLNNAYVLIGTKSDLARKGVTKRGKMVADAALDRSKFFKVDIREWREISFQAKRPRILTDMPLSAYELTTSGDKTFTLRVKNPADFWRVSNFLVIQTD